MDFEYFEQYNLGNQYIARDTDVFTTPPGILTTATGTM